MFDEEFPIAQFNTIEDAQLWAEEVNEIRLNDLSEYDRLTSLLQNEQPIFNLSNITEVLTFDADSTT